MGLIQKNSLLEKTSLLFTIILFLTMFLISCSDNRTQIQTSPLLDTFQRKSGRISYIGIDGNIYTVDQGGKKDTALTVDAGINSELRSITNYGNPTWETTGNRIAFTRTEITEQQVLTTKILISNKQGTKIREVMTSNTLRPIYMYWSPDSKYISLLSQPLGDNQFELGLIDIDSTSYQTLDQGQPFYWTWLPDSTKIMTHIGGDSRTNPKARLNLQSINPTNPDTNFSNLPTSFQSPAISPNGKSIAYVGTITGDLSNIIVQNLDGTNQITLTEVPGYAYLAYSPKNEDIAIMQSKSQAVSADGQLSIFNVRYDSKVQLPETDIIAFFWSPNGKRIAYMVPARFRDDQRLNLEPYFARQQDLLYVELRVYNVSSGDSWKIVQFPITEIFLRNYLPFFDQYQRSSTIWSPDSRFITYSALTTEGVPGVFVSSATGSLKPQIAAAGDFALWSR